MTVKQQEEFYAKVCDMLDKLSRAEEKDKKAEACIVMVEVFGSEFPVNPERSIVGHSESA